MFEFETAEEMLEKFRDSIASKLGTLRTITFAQPALSALDYAKLRAAFSSDDEMELIAALAAMNVALSALAKPMVPFRDELRG